MDEVEGPELMFSGTWRRLAPRPADASGRDGSDLACGIEIDFFAEPLKPAAAENRYGVTGMKRPHLVMVDPDVAGEIREGDQLDWPCHGLDLTIKQVQTFSYPDVSHTEILAEAKTRGRG